MKRKVVTVLTLLCSIAFLGCGSAGTPVSQEISQLCPDGAHKVELDYNGNVENIICEGEGEGEGVDGEGREHGVEAGEAVLVWDLELEHHDGDDDGDDSVGEGFEAGWSG